MHTPPPQASLDYHLRRTNRLTNEELIAELTDHYTIALSERMAQGLSLEAALSDIQQSFGGRKGLQKMERQYNRITFRKYDSLWMQYIRKQIGWPDGLRPLCTYILSYLMLTSTGRPTPVSTDILVQNPWSGLIWGAVLGLLIKIGQLVFQNGIKGRSFSCKAIYLSTRVLPIAIFLYGLCLLLTYLSTYLPPFVYEATLSACAAMTVVYTLSYSLFYKDVLKENPPLS